MKKIIGLFAVVICLSFIGFNSSNKNTTETPVQEMSGYLGEVRMFAGNFVPAGWAYCDGQLLPIASNQALFSIIGTMYGGDARTTFALPDLRGRVAIGSRQGPGLSSYRPGNSGGSERMQLNENNLPSSVAVTPAYEINPNDPDSKYVPGSSSVVVVGNSPNTNVNARIQGTSNEINNMQPYLTVNYIICVKGQFPSRD